MSRAEQRGRVYWTDLLIFMSCTQSRIHRPDIVGLGLAMRVTFLVSLGCFSHTNSENDNAFKVP